VVQALTEGGMDGGVIQWRKQSCGNRYRQRQGMLGVLLTCEVTLARDGVVGPAPQCLSRRAAPGGWRAASGG
jgi:hypothetical protein